MVISKITQMIQAMQNSMKKVGAEMKAETLEMATEKKIPEKKTTAKKAPARKPAEKKTATTRKTGSNPLIKDINTFVQFNDKEISEKELVKRIIEKWCTETRKKERDIKEFNIYIKPEDNAAYYVINGQGDSVGL